MNKIKTIGFLFDFINFRISQRRKFYIIKFYLKGKNISTLLNVRFSARLKELNFLGDKIFAP